LYTEIFVSVGWTIFTFAAGWSGRKWTKHRQEVRPAARVWKIDPKIPVHIFTADPPATDATELTSVVYPAEYAAAAELSVYLKQMFHCNIKGIFAGKEFRGDETNENIVIIGGPNHNPVFKKYQKRLNEKLDELGLSLPYSFNGYDLVRKSDGRVFKHEVESNETKGDRIVRDFGLIMLADNPYKEHAKRSRVIFLAGCRTYGCLAAARAVSDPHILKTAALMSEEEVVAFVVEASISDEYLAEVRLVDPAPETRVLGKSMGRRV
jgi:hypothetical protein